MQQVNRPFLFAITGGIASGKTLFAEMLRESGFTIYDTDVIAHQMIEKARVLLVQRWGTGILDGLGINRGEVARIVFESENERLFLNSILHPMILEEMQSIIEHTDEEHIGFEIPLLFETGLQDCFDLSILVTATYDTRIERLIDRGMDSNEAKSRISSQMTEEEKGKLADIIVNNDHDIISLKKEALNTGNVIRQSRKKETIAGFVSL